MAEQYGLETTSDLAAVAGELTFGGNPDYIEREDGFGALCQTYGLEFGLSLIHILTSDAIREIYEIAAGLRD